MFCDVKIIDEDVKCKFYSPSAWLNSEYCKSPMNIYVLSIKVTLILKLLEFHINVVIMGLVVSSMLSVAINSHSQRISKKVWNTHIVVTNSNDQKVVTK